MAERAPGPPRAARPATSPRDRGEDLRTETPRGRHAHFPARAHGYLISDPPIRSPDFGLTQEFGGRCHLRFDDTNPTKDEQEYIDAIEFDVRWLGFDWGSTSTTLFRLLRAPP